MLESELNIQMEGEIELNEEFQNRNEAAENEAELMQEKIDIEKIKKARQNQRSNEQKDYVPFDESTSGGLLAMNQISENKAISEA